MIVVLKPNPNPEQVQGFISWLEGKGIAVHKSVGVNETVFGLVGDTASLDIGLIAALDIVEDVKRIVEPYKDANRKFHPEDTVIPVGNTQIGGGTLTIMAGPCSVESEEQLVGIAKAVKASGATILRGGAFKPRTSPYSSKTWTSSRSAPATCRTSTCSRQSANWTSLSSSNAACAPPTKNC